MRRRLEFCFVCLPASATFIQKLYIAMLRDINWDKFTYSVLGSSRAEKPLKLTLMGKLPPHSQGYFATSSQVETSRNTCFVSIHFTFLLGRFRHLVFNFGLRRHDCSTVDSYYDTKTWRDALSTHKPLISITDLQFRLVSINGRVRTMIHEAFDVFETLRVRESERRKQREDYRIEEK